MIATHPPLYLVGYKNPEKDIGAWYKTGLRAFMDVHSSKFGPILTKIGKKNWPKWSIFEPWSLK